MEDLIHETSSTSRNNHTTTANDSSLIVYTSGTTGPPKGVVYSRANLFHQIQCLIQPWGITAKDHYLHVLPLHHVHGIVNCLLCPLTVGGSVTMLPKFSPQVVRDHLLDESNGIDVFMAVPTIYAKLIQDYDYKKWEKGAQVIKEKFRLMVSGSAALPTVNNYRSKNTLIRTVQIGHHGKMSVSRLEKKSALKLFIPDSLNICRKTYPKIKNIQRVPWEIFSFFLMSR